MNDQLTLDPKTTAMIIQDLQNDVISEGGAFAGDGGYDHAKSQNVVENVARLAAAARSVGVPVIHVHYVVDPGAPGTKLNAGLYRAVKESDALVRGTWGAAAAPGVEPQEGDLVVEKMRTSAFYNTRLMTLLQGFGTETVIVTGAWTHMSIEHTARYGADAGYRMIVINDACSSINDEWHNAGLNYALTAIGEVASLEQAIEALGARVAA
ncbi:MAG: cysteine hydrolase [Gaiellaceae bacterium]